MEMPAYLNLQNKDFIVKHAIVILRLNLILSMITRFISNKTKLAVLNKAQESPQKSIVKSCLISSMTVSRVINRRRGQSSLMLYLNTNDGRI